MRGRIHRRSECKCQTGDCTKQRSNELAYYRLLHEILRPASGVDQADGIRVDAQVVIKRGEYLLEMDGPLARLLAQAVGCADHPAGFHAAAGEQRAAHVRPVVAASILVY